MIEMTLPSRHKDSKFEPWRYEAEHATSRSRRLPTILIFTRGWGRNIFVSFKPPRPGTEPRTLAWKAAVLTTTLGPPPVWQPIKHETLNQCWFNAGLSSAMLAEHEFLLKNCSLQRLIFARLLWHWTLAQVSITFIQCWRPTLHTC